MTRSVDPIMLTTMREARGLSQTALAELAGVTQPSVSRYEKGTSDPTPVVIDSLAASLGCPPTLLHQRLPFQSLPLTFFRKLSSVGMKTTRRIRARVNLFAWRLSILLQAAPPPDLRITSADTDDDGMSATRAAQGLRVYWNLPPGPIRDLTHLVESYGVIVVPMNFRTRSIDGLSLYDPAGPLPPLIFVNPAAPADRWRMNIAHELAHIIIHYHRDVLPDSTNLEREAFEFAAAFLMPQRDIRGHLRSLDMQRLASLKEHWRVSMAALLKRSESLNYTTAWQARRLWIELKRGGARSEPVSISPEDPTTVKRIVDYHINTLNHSINSFAQLIHQDASEVCDDWGINRHLKLT